VFARSRADAVIASCRLADGSALDLLSHVRRIAPGTTFLVLADGGELLSELLQRRLPLAAEPRLS